MYPKLLLILCKIVGPVGRAQVEPGYDARQRADSFFRFHRSWGTKGCMSSWGMCVNVNTFLFLCFLACDYLLKRGASPGI